MVKRKQEEKNDDLGGNTASNPGLCFGRKKIINKEKVIHSTLISPWF